MIDMHAIAKSKKLNDEAKNHFASLNITECVIEISLDKPMSEWVIHFTKTEEEMYNKRSELIDFGVPFIAIYTETEGRYFFFTDFVTRTLELLDTNSLIFSNLAKFSEVSKSQLIKELSDLKKMLQKE